MKADRHLLYVSIVLDVILEKQILISRSQQICWCGVESEPTCCRTH